MVKFKTNKKPQAAAGDIGAVSGKTAAKHFGAARKGFGEMLAAHTFRRSFVDAK